MSHAKSEPEKQPPKLPLPVSFTLALRYHGASNTPACLMQQTQRLNASYIDRELLLKVSRTSRHALLVQQSLAAPLYACHSENSCFPSNRAISIPRRISSLLLADQLVPAPHAVVLSPCLLDPVNSCSHIMMSVLSNRPTVYRPFSYPRR